ncbi:histidine kinase [Mucilaginibacter sabulilitoris]|uniref:Histidine kinase n=1 Tax=Mucilaginibacter sabulilitoris TaxID=1173583 RepID=A0ABZ0TTK1_9SPHI|nr:histidine kinase [Mucilaginibacter sabulilitoris]WPU96096.1 histidine kinase [Mucilaginibacter sabulilitoris]
MQKWRIFLFLQLIVLAACHRDIRYDASDAVISQPDTAFTASVQIDLLEKKFSSSLGLQVHSFGAFVVYWDGIRVGQNGVPATTGQPEVPGTETSYYQIPDKLSGLGKHNVMIRGTQKYLLETERNVMAKPESYLKMLRQPLIELSLVNLMAGAFLIAAIYYTFLFANSRHKQRTTLLFAQICFLFFTLLAMEYLKYYIDIPYTQFYTRLIIVGWLTFAIAVLIPVYFAVHFDVPHKLPFIGILLAALVSIYILKYGHYDLTAHLYSLALWIASVLILLYALIKKQRGSVLVLCGFAVSMVINQYMFYDFGLYIAFTLILLCILYLQTLGAKQLEEAHHASLLLSSRLQLELIKKNIQPHFLRNTLTSLMDWVEESPAQGVLFIQALSQEFDVMNEIAERSLIPIRQEINLCRHHLSVMQFRKEVTYIWEDAGIQDDEVIPPAIIHTLLENGITHGIPSNGSSIRFLLTFLHADTHKQYTFEVFAENRVRSGRKSGNGFRYIEARLKESYGDRWNFTSEPFAGGWRSIIRIDL